MQATPLTIFTALCALGCLVVFIKTASTRQPKTALFSLLMMAYCIYVTSMLDNSGWTL